MEVHINQKVYLLGLNELIYGKHLVCLVYGKWSMKDNYMESSVTEMEKLLKNAW